MKDGVVMSTSVEAVGYLWKVKLPRASEVHGVTCQTSVLSFLCPHVSVNTLVLFFS